MLVEPGGLFVAAYELELVDESRPIAHLLRVEIAVDAGRDAIGEQVEYEYARHVRVLRVNARLLLGRAYLAHVLGVGCLPFRFEARPTIANLTYIDLTTSVFEKFVFTISIEPA